MQVLSDPALRAQMQAEYDHIFVDECQDVSQIQDAILQAIHNDDNVMFMVGDVKQSIYRFRKADPTLFMERLRTYSDDLDAKYRRIILQKNFRSRYNVLEATNEVFRKAMRPNVTELTYDPIDELICGRDTENDPPVEMHLLDVSANDDGEAVEALYSSMAGNPLMAGDLRTLSAGERKAARNIFDTFREVSAAGALTDMQTWKWQGDAGNPDAAPDGYFRWSRLSGEGIAVFFANGSGVDSVTVKLPVPGDSPRDLVDPETMESVGRFSADELRKGVTLSLNGKKVRGFAVRKG
jgi:hypothetical protein